jgi:toxin ParE1/3/4
MVRYFGWLEAEAGTDAAERFMAAADNTFAKLASSPQVGPVIESRNANLAGVRKWRVDGFDNMLVFYSARHKGVLILRVLHSAQDWWAIFDLDQQP